MFHLLYIFVYICVYISESYRGVLMLLYIYVLKNDGTCHIILLYICVLILL